MRLDPVYAGLHGPGYIDEKHDVPLAFRLRADLTLGLTDSGHTALLSCGS